MTLQILFIPPAAGGLDEIFRASGRHLCREKTYAQQSTGFQPSVSFHKNHHCRFPVKKCAIESLMR